MMSLILLPIICVCTLYCICYSKLPDTGIYSRIRIALLHTFIITGLFIAVSTEALSYGHHITLRSVGIAWAAFTVSLVSYAVYRKVPILILASTCKKIATFLKSNPLLLVIPVLLIISSGIAITYPTNNHDSLTYHMARVEHWINNRSVSHYQTHIERQLLMPPLAEWMILHAQLLFASDHLANFIQTIFFGACILQVSLVTKSLGGNTKMQVLSCLFTALIPMAIIESNTTQNDVVVALYVLAFVYYVIEIINSKYIREGKIEARRIYSNSVASPRNLLYAGVSLGLAMLTKGTSYLFCIIFFGWFAFTLFARYRQPLWNIIRAGLQFSIILIIAIALNYGHFYRNIFYSGSIAGDATKWVANEGSDLKSIAFVGIKNVMNHMPVTREMKKSLSDLAFYSGVDINDPKYNYNTMSWMMVGLSYHEDYAQNFLHTVLIAIALAVFYFRRKIFINKVDIWLLYVSSCIVICLLYTIMFKWQPWGNRLETPIFMLFCPLLAWLVSRWKPLVQMLVLLPFFYFAANAVTLSARHPLLPPEKNIFNKPYDKFIYSDGMIECKKYMDTTSSASFGVVVGRDSPDYVYYKMMAESKRGRRPMIHVLVDNPSRMYLNNLVPETIISLDRRREKLTFSGRTYVRSKLLESGGPAIFSLQ